MPSSSWSLFPRQLWEPMRSGLELTQLGPALPRLWRAPRGDGHAVLVLPGFLGGDLSTMTLRYFLRQLGYDARGWGLGTNTGPSDELQEGLLALLRSAAEHERRVSLIGWSLGGLYAVELAAMVPSLVRQVVTLGAPLNVLSTRARRAPVPISAVYSRDDAIVDWRRAALPPGPHRERIEVHGSHLGLGHNAEVLLVVANRLAQPEGRWAPYEQPQAA